MKSNGREAVQHREASALAIRPLSLATVTRSLILGMVVLLAASGFSATKGSLRLNDPVKVSGQTLSPGDYKVEWNGDGPDIELSISQGKHLIASVPAHLIQSKVSATANAAVTRKSDSGANNLVEIRFQGKKTSVDFSEPNAGSAQAGQAQE